MYDTLSRLIFLAGLGQLSVLVASSLVPLRLDWKTTFAGLPRLYRQMYWVYGGYVVLGIVANGLLSTFHHQALAEGSGLARSVCAYIAVFWGIRLCLQPIFDVKPFLTVWWLRAGYHTLTVLFIFFTGVFAFAALRPAG